MDQNKLKLLGIKPQSQIYHNYQILQDKAIQNKIINDNYIYIEGVIQM